MSTWADAYGSSSGQCWDTRLCAVYSEHTPKRDFSQTHWHSIQWNSATSFIHTKQGLEGLEWKKVACYLLCPKFFWSGVLSSLLREPAVPCFHWSKSTRQPRAVGMKTSLGGWSRSDSGACLFSGTGLPWARPYSLSVVKEGTTRKGPRVTSHMPALGRKKASHSWWRTWCLYLHWVSDFGGWSNRKPNALQNILSYVLTKGGSPCDLRDGHAELVAWVCGGELPWH